MPNSVFYGLWSEKEPLCVQSLPQTLPQAEDVRASFLFVGDLNGHHQEWLGSTTSNRHGVAAFDFATVSVCDQLVVGSTHARGGTLDLLLTDVPDLVRVVTDVPPVDNIWLSDNPVEVLNEHLSLLVGRYVPTKVIRVRNNAGMFLTQAGISSPVDP